MKEINKHLQVSWNTKPMDGNKPYMCEVLDALRAEFPITAQYDDVFENTTQDFKNLASLVVTIREFNKQKELRSDPNVVSALNLTDMILAGKDKEDTKKALQKCVFVRLVHLVAAKTAADARKHEAIGLFLDYVFNPVSGLVGRLGPDSHYFVDVWKTVTRLAAQSKYAEPAGNAFTRGADGSDGAGPSAYQNSAVYPEMSPEDIYTYVRGNKQAIIGELQKETPDLLNDMIFQCCNMMNESNYLDGDGTIKTRTPKRGGSAGSRAAAALGLLVTAASAFMAAP